MPRHRRRQIWERYDPDAALGDNLIVGASLGLVAGLLNELLLPGWRTIYRH